MQDQLRTLTPSERANLPPCHYSIFGRCAKKAYSKSECIRCLIDGIFFSLQKEEIANATSFLDSLVEALKEQKLI
jgi:hypothetical protein